MCEKHNNIHKTVQNTFQHETVDLKTPLQDLQLKFFLSIQRRKDEINIYQVTFP
jgi:hypothetical protein